MKWSPETAGGHAAPPWTSGCGERIGVFGPFARDSGRIGILKAYPRATVSPDCRGGADLPGVAILGYEINGVSPRFRTPWSLEMISNLKEINHCSQPLRQYLALLSSPPLLLTHGEGPPVVGFLLFGG